MSVALETSQWYKLIDSYSGLHEVTRSLAATNGCVCLDSETTGFHPQADKLLTVQLYQEGGVPYVLDWREADERWPLLLLEHLENRVVVGHNLAFDWQFLYANGMCLDTLFDTMIAEQVIYGVGPKGITLKSLVKKYCGVEMSKEERQWWVGLDQRPEYNEPYPDNELEYAALDVYYLPEIRRKQIAKLTERGLLDVFRLEMRALPAIAAMQYNGISINVDGWREVIREQEAKAKELECQVTEAFGAAVHDSRLAKYDAALAEYAAWEKARDTYLSDLHSSWYDKHDKKEKGWGEFKKQQMEAWNAAHAKPVKPKLDQNINIGSHVQLLEAFRELGIPAQSAEAEVLEKLAPKFPVLQPLLNFKKCQKNVSTYGESLLAKADVSGRMYPGYNQIGAETGRMSSHSPNWQNLPARSDVGKQLRKCVIAAPGCKLLTADYSIIELRILAEMSGDKNMLNMFASGMDLHTFTARKMFKLPDTMTDEEVKNHKLPSGLKARDVAKTINYGVAYGQSAFGFASKFNVDVDTAQGFIDQYYQLYGGAKKFLERSADDAEQNLRSLTILGRKRFYTLPEKPGRNATWEQRKEYKAAVASVRRQGTNARIQGTSADMTKLALALFWERANHEEQRLVACVHDEIVVECHEVLAVYTAALLSLCMLDACRAFLDTVFVPSPFVHIGDEWEH